MDMTTLAPLPAKNRRILARMVGRPDATDDQLLATPQARNIEFRKVPRKAAVLDRIARQAREVVEQLAAEGVEFAGTVEQAARVVTASAYAAWRAFHGRKEDEPGDRDVTILLGFSEGLEHARHYREGMPAMIRHDYLVAVAGSDDPIDRMPLGRILEALWPHRYRGGRIRGRRPARQAAGSEAAEGSWDDQLEGNVASIFEDVRRKPR
jgi:hypothetical protein